MESYATSLRANHAFKSREIKHSELMDKWQLRCKSTTAQSSPSVAAKSKQQQRPAVSSAESPITRKKVLSPAELSKRIGKLRTAVAALNRQLDSQLLHSYSSSDHTNGGAWLQKQYDSLNLQQKALETVQAALDKLGPMVRTTEKDFEFLGSHNSSNTETTASVSIEAVESVTGTLWPLL